ncbi:DMT family transporter [Vreelandella massiliensis]|uniref:DMT family transporter n=1 Tax=Vreelandella massiliensis TaxID=1816686 RepID=UPI00096A8D09|nr:EamA family transporter [Halomonas massiliensis]
MYIGSIFVALAALFWGITGAIATQLMALGWDAALVSLCRGAIGLLCFLAWLALRPQQSGLSNPQLWKWSLLAGLGVAGNFTFYFLSIAEGSIAIAATLMYCAPVFVYLVSFALKIERPTVINCGAILLVMLGIVLLTRLYDVSAGDVTATGIVTGLLAGLSYTLFIFGFKHASVHGSNQASLSISFVVMVGVMSVWSGLRTGFALPALDSQTFALLAGLGFLGAGLSFVLYFQGLKLSLPTVASIVALVEPVTATLLGYAIFAQQLKGLQIAGMVLILVTVTALTIYSNWQRTRMLRKRGIEIEPPAKEVS